MQDTTARRGTRRRLGLRRVVVVALATVLVVAAFGGSAHGQSNKKLLGPKAPASGTPVKVGFVFDGKSPSTDSTCQLQASQAIVKYLNDYQKGLGGHPIELVSCESGQNNTAGATDCANQLVQAGVVLGVLAE